jgi:hypothetical protein
MRLALRGCHGAAMTGASRHHLAYVRYHTDDEVTATIRQKHATLQIPDPELRQILDDVRVLAGTNPSMATGGYRRRWTRGPPACPPPAGPPSRRRPHSGRRGRGGAPAAPLARADRHDAHHDQVADGKHAGPSAGQSDLDATLLENGKFVLLSRDGDLYREKPIAPKADWLMYDGSLTGNRFSPLEQINTSSIKRLGPVWMFPVPGSPRLEVTPTVVDGIMYVGGWNR